MMLTHSSCTELQGLNPSMTQKIMWFRRPALGFFTAVIPAISQDSGRLEKNMVPLT